MAQILEFAGNHPFLILAAAVLVVLIIVNEVRLRMRGVTQLSPAEAIARINKGALVIDLRSPEQYRDGHIINAMNVPTDELQGRYAELAKKHAGKAVVVYGSAGTAGAVRGLRTHGFEEVFELHGGLDAWRRENLPVEKKGAPAAGGSRKPKRKRAKT